MRRASLTTSILASLTYGSLMKNECAVLPHLSSLLGYGEQRDSHMLIIPHQSRHSRYDYEFILDHKLFKDFDRSVFCDERSFQSLSHLFHKLD